MTEIIEFTKYKEKDNPNKQVNVIGFFQDKYYTMDKFKEPLPKGYLDSLDYPFHIKEEMKDLKNSWKGFDGNIHFSKKWNPDPYVGNDNEVYLMLGDITMKDKTKTMNLMVKGMELLKKVSE